MTVPLNLEQILGFLLDTPMFSNLGERELSEVVHIMQVQRLRSGQLLFREGDVGDAWYVLYDGEVEILVQGEQGPQVFTRLAAPAHFGEMAVLDGHLRSASARAATEVSVLRFPRDAFQLLLKQDNLAAYKLVAQMAQGLASRHREMTRRVVELTSLGRLEDVMPELASLLRDRRRAE